MAILTFFSNRMHQHPFDYKVQNLFHDSLTQIQIKKTLIVIPNTILVYRLCIIKKKEKS